MHRGAIAMVPLCLDITCIMQANDFAAPKARLDRWLSLDVPDGRDRGDVLAQLKPHPKI